MKFSVLLVIHKSDNLKHFIECLESLCNQTLIPAEVILVSDGNLPEKYIDVIQANRSLNIRYLDYHGEEKLVGALNFGLKHCSFKTVCRMDPDDICRPTRFENQVKYFLSNKVAVLGSNICEFDLKPKDLTESIRTVPKRTSKRNIYFRNPVNHMTATYDRDVIQSLGGYEFVEGFEDWHLWLKVFKNGGMIKNLEETLVDVRVGNGFYKRRSGINYAIKEFKAYTKFYFDGLIPLSSYIFGIMFRVPVRILPKSVLSLIYKKSRI